MHRNEAREVLSYGIQKVSLDWNLNYITEKYITVDTDTNMIVKLKKHMEIRRAR